MNFAQTLSNLMAKKGLTNYQLAKDLDVHQTTVANWLEGKPPRRKTAMQLADYFNVTVDYLLGADQKESAPITEADEELYEIREAVRRDPDLRLLFSLGKSATPDDVRKYIKVIKAMKGDIDE